MTMRDRRVRQAWRERAVAGTGLQIVGEELCEALDIRAGQSVLDVAAGGGNVTSCPTALVPRGID